MEINLKDNVIQIQRSSVSSLNVPKSQMIRVRYEPCTDSTMAWLVARPGPSTISRRLMPPTPMVTANTRHTSSRAETRKVECQKMLYQSLGSCGLCGLKDLLPCCFCETEIAIFLFFFQCFIQFSQGTSISSSQSKIHCSILLFCI